jgi:cysteine-rich repeat protein
MSSHSIQGAMADDEAWHHIAATWNPGTGVMSLYVDGVSQSSLSDTTPDSTSLGLKIGPFPGFIDEVSIYDRALGASEIQAIASAASAGKCTDCGDGMVGPGEECDDGNTAAGDCCSPLCRLDPIGVSCGDDGVSCTQDRCDAFGVCTHPDSYGTCGCSTTATSLVSWWQLEGTAEDTLYYGNDGVVQPGAGFGPSVVGTGLRHDTGEDGGSVIVPHHASLDLGDAGFSAEFWVRGSNDGQPRVLFEKSYDDATGKGWAFQVDADGQVAFVVGTGVPGNPAVVDSAGADVFDPGIFGIYDYGNNGNFGGYSQTHHVAGTYHPPGTYHAVLGELRLYLDGELRGTRSISQPVNHALDVYIGNSHDPAQQAGFGHIDEPSIYNRALSEAQVREIFSAGRAGKCLPEPGMLAMLFAGTTLLMALGRSRSRRR